MTTTPPIEPTWLSVLIPVYNVEGYLEACVASVLEQADAGVEILLYDDCSTDGSWPLMQSLAANHPGRLTLLRGDLNRGLSAARNQLLDASCGEWIWFLDSDDFLLPGAIAGLKAWSMCAEVDLVLCDFRDHHDQLRLRQRLFGERQQRTQGIPAGRPCSELSKLLEGAFVQSQLHAWSKIGRRSLYRHDLRFPEGRYFEDVYLTPTLMTRARQVVYVNEAWIAYRKRAGSILSTPSPQKWQDLQDSMNHLPALLSAQRPALSQQTLAAAGYFIYRSWMRASKQAAKAGDWGTVKAQLRQCERNANLPLRDVLGYCLRRGWWWRAWRILSTVRQAQRR